MMAKRKKITPRLGEKVLYRNDAWNEPETPRLAHVTGFGTGGLLHLTISRNPVLDAGESVMMMRPNVVLLDADEAPGRHVREWCWYGEYSMGDAGTVTGRGRDIPLVDSDPEADLEEDGVVAEKELD